MKEDQRIIQLNKYNEKRMTKREFNKLLRFIRLYQKQVKLLVANQKETMQEIPIFDPEQMQGVQ